MLATIDCDYFKFYAPQLYSGLQWAPVSDGALLPCRGSVWSGDGWNVEEEWLLRRQPDHQLPVPLLEGDHVRQGHPHAAGGCGLVAVLYKFCALQKCSEGENFAHVVKIAIGSM